MSRRIFTLTQNGGKIHFLVIAGQSNGDGSTTYGEVIGDPTGEYIYPNKNAYITDAKLDEIFVPLDWANESWTGLYHGAELGVAKELKNSKLFIGKVSEGATGLETDWFENSRLRNELISRILYMKWYTQENNITPIWSFYWNQWENDSETLGYSSNYYTNYISMFNDIQSKTGVTFDNHLVQSVFTEGNLYAARPTNCDLIIDAHNTLESQNGVKIISSENLTMWDPFVHYTSESQHEIGRRIALEISK